MISYRQISTRYRLDPALTCFGLFLLASRLHVAPVVVAAPSSPDNWYTKYPAYHPYCSTREQIKTRDIPQVADDARLGQSRLLHATVIVRHGARTPWTALDCWEGYAPAWNCNLTTYLATPPPQRIAQEEGYVNPDAYQSGLVLFEKRYDALQDPGRSNQFSNILNGTCQQGQLILQGYEQELQNGQFLRNAYVYNNGGSANTAAVHNERMKLLDTSQSIDALLESLYYRVDDDQRTLMSGQVVLRGLLGPELIDSWGKNNGKHPVLPLHTADRLVDILDPNESNCERLQEIRERYKHSAEYQTFVQSNETKLLEGFWKDVLGRKLDASEFQGEVLDCLFTTMCTDRELPESLNDYSGNYTTRLNLQDKEANDNDTDVGMDEGHSDESSSDNDNSGYGQHLFQRFYRYGTNPYTLLYQANNAEYAKLGMAPLWAEIMSQIYAVTKEPDHGCCPPVLQPAKLALYAGHDTTIMPLLASLGKGVWDGEWAPYASMVVLEIHQVHIDGNTDKTLYRSNYAFRLIYNGEILTHHVDGCAQDAQLCDVQLLLDVVRPFATRHVDCRRKFPLTVTHEDTVSRIKKIVSTPEGVAAVVVVLLGSFLAGVVSTYFCIRRSQRPRRPRRQIKVATEEEDGDIALTENGHVDVPDVAIEGNGYEDEPSNHGSIT